MSTFGCLSGLSKIIEEGEIKNLHHPSQRWEVLIGRREEDSPANRWAPARVGPVQAALELLELSVCLLGKKTCGLKEA